METINSATENDIKSTAEASMAAVVFRLKNSAKTNSKPFSSFNMFKPKSLKMIWLTFPHTSVNKNKFSSDRLELKLFFLTVSSGKRDFLPYDKKLCRVLKAYSPDVQHNRICAAINKTKIFLKQLTTLL